MASKRGNSWEARVKAPDKYHRYSFKTLAAAEQWEREAREAVKNGTPVPKPTVTGADPTLQSFFNEYGATIWADTNWKNIVSGQRAVEKVLGSNTLLSQIDERRLTQMVNDLRKERKAPGTINTRLSHVRVLLRYAKKLGHEVPTISMPWVKKLDNSRLQFLTVEQETAILQLFRHWGLDDIANLVETLIDTGCRPGELIRGDTKGAPIKWSEVSKSAGGEAPDVNDPATGQPKAVISLMRTKNGKYRVLPLTDRAKKNFLISKQRGDKRPFGDLRADMVSEKFRMAADHLGMDDYVLYSCRHTCASRLVQRGADIRRVMQWMGHTNINTTLRYAKLTPTDIFGIGDLL